MHLIRHAHNIPLYGISQNPDTKYYIFVFQHILYCKRCGEYMEYLVGYDDEWCKKCQINDLKLDFTNWTSGNNKIDHLIQKMQLEIVDSDNIIFEWIPYNQFSNIKKIKEGNFIKIYSTIWKNDLLYYDCLYKRQEKMMTLKFILKYSQNITDEVQ
jgi:hypothetical protein